MKTEFDQDDIKNILRVKDILLHQTRPSFRGLQAKSIITGGCIGSYLRGETPRDIDVFVYNMSEDYKDTEVGAELLQLLDNYRFDRVEYTKDTSKYSNHTILDVYNQRNPKSPIQVIIERSEKPEYIVGNFDFLSATPYFDGEKFNISPLAYWSIMNKVALPVKTGPIENRIKAYRVEKYKAAGWDVSQVEKYIGNNKTGDLMEEIHIAEKATFEFLAEQKFQDFIKKYPQKDNRLWPEIIQDIVGRSNGDLVIPNYNATTSNLPWDNNK